MRSEAARVGEYPASLPDDHRAAIEAVRRVDLRPAIAPVAGGSRRCPG